MAEATSSTACDCARRTPAIEETGTACSGSVSVTVVGSVCIGSADMAGKLVATTVASCGSVAGIAVIVSDAVAPVDVIAHELASTVQQLEVKVDCVDCGVEQRGAFAGNEASAIDVGGSCSFISIASAGCTGVAVAAMASFGIWGEPNECRGSIVCIGCTA